jgi:hypothetical protein
MTERELMQHFLGLVKESDELRRALRLNLISAEMRRLRRENEELRAKCPPRLEVVRDG